MPPPGYFGKVPARGDFVACRLVPALAEPWDVWLGLLTTAAHGATPAPDWPEAWLTAPLWRFALGAGLVPEPGAAGILVASVDRVGRMFPFTVIGAAPGVPDEAWFDAAEALALAALADDADLDALDAGLVWLGPPGDVTPLEPGRSLWRCRGSVRMGPSERLLH